MSLAALGAIAGGLNQGMTLAQQDQELRDQRAFREEDRTFKKLQQDDLLKRQARENEAAVRQDKYAAERAAAEAPRDVAGKAALDAFANEQPITTRAPTDVERLTAIKTAQVNARDYAGAADTDKTLRSMFSDIDRQNYGTFAKSASGMDFNKAAMAAADLVSADGSPLVVEKPKAPNADGSYTFNVRNKHNGTAVPFTARNTQELLTGLQQHMDYDTYAANVNAQRAAALKTHEVAPGGIVVRGDGTKIAENPNEPAAVLAARIRAGAGGASGAGATGKAGNAVNPQDAYMAEVDNSAKNSEVKYATTAEASQARDYIAAMAHYNGYDVTKLSPQRAHLVAGRIMSGKAPVSSGFDAETGVPIVGANDPDYGFFKLGPGQAPKTKAEAEAAAKAMLSKQGTPEEQKLYHMAAFDTSGPNGTSLARGTLEAGIRSKADALVQEAIKINPAAEKQIRERANQRVTEELSNVGRKLNIIRSYMPTPKSDSEVTPVAEKKSAAERLKGAVGLPTGILSSSRQITDQKAKEEAESKAAAEAYRIGDKANRSQKDILKNEVSAVPPDAILQSNNLNELIAFGSKYALVMNPEQRKAFEHRVSQLQSQSRRTAVGSIRSSQE